MKTKILHLNDFLSNFKLFCYSNFTFVYIHEKFLKNFLKTFQMIHITYITQILKLILKTIRIIFCMYKNWLVTIKHFFIIFLYTYIKMVNKYYQ